MLPTVNFCGINTTRLLIGANPFGGYSHQSEKRDNKMREFHTIERIKETWKRAEAAGINTMVTNNETPHVMQAVQEYLREGGKLQWIAQVNVQSKPYMFDAIDKVIEVGCKALYFHGALVDEAYQDNDKASIIKWCSYARSKGIPTGVAGHAHEAHLWVNELDVTDFHTVCFFNCGSLHYNKGEKFRLQDMKLATDTIKRIKKPCIGYKIMGAGRIDPKMAFEYAFDEIKPTDIVNVGMHRGDNDNIVEENVSICEKILS